MRERVREMLPLVPLCGLALALLVNGAMGKKDQTFEGLFVADFYHTEFYPNVRDCNRHGTPYWLVPTNDFGKVVSYSVDFDNPHSSRQDTWRVKLRGDLSHLGHFGFRGAYWRQLSVSYVIDATPLNCGAEK